MTLCQEILFESQNPVPFEQTTSRLEGYLKSSVVKAGTKFPQGKYELMHGLCKTSVADGPLFHAQSRIKLQKLK